MNAILLIIVKATLCPHDTKIININTFVIQEYTTSNIHACRSMIVQKYMQLHT